jgi:putative endonuclease
LDTKTEQGIQKQSKGFKLLAWLRSPLYARLRRAHLRLGRRGEQAAAAKLQQLGLEILCRNYRSGRYEIDIVARDEAQLCFVEVKTRRYKPGIRPAEAVNAAKKRRIIRAARRYLRDIGAVKLKLRFDIVEVVSRKYAPFRINYIKNAFRQKSLATQY